MGREDSWSSGVCGVAEKGALGDGGSLERGVGIEFARERRRRRRRRNDEVVREGDGICLVFLLAGCFWDQEV